jgi:hypothetical protein
MVSKLGSRARVASLACVLVAVLAVAACDPVPSGGGVNPLTCLPRVTTAADYQRAFDQRGPVWSGGDGAVPVPLPDGRVLWMFGDTELGPVVNNRFVAPQNFVHNTFIVQTGTCFQPFVGGSAARPTEWFRNPAPNQYYWPGSAVVDPSRRTVHVFLLLVQNVPGVAEWGFKTIGTRVATLSLPDLRVQSITALPLPSSAGTPLYGSGAVVSGGYTYLYGNRQITTGWLPRGEEYVARVAANVTGPWQYWDGTGWSANAADAAPMTFLRADASVDDPPVAGLTVVPYGSGWLASAKRGEIISSDVTAWYSASVTGPWSPVNLPDGRVATTVTDNSVDQFSYNGRVVVLPGSGPTVVYSVNTTNDPAKRLDAHLYGPRFATPVGLPAPVTVAGAH